MSTVVTGETIIVDHSNDSHSDLRVFFAVAEERGHAAASVVVDEGGRPVTDPCYSDRMGAPHLPGGAWAFCRSPQAEALGFPTGTDFVRTHAPHLSFLGGSPYPAEPHFHRQLYIQEFGQPESRLQIPGCSAGPVAWRPDGRKVCVLDERLGRFAALPDAAKYVLWEYDLALGQRRRVVDLPPAWPLSHVELTYSSDGLWLHLCDWIGGANYLVGLADGIVVPLPFRSVGAGWNPGNGANAMTVTTVEPMTGRLVIHDYDVSTGSMEQRSDIASSNGLPLAVRELSMSTDGNRALVTAPLGATGLEQQRRGGVNVAVVIDIVDGAVDPVLPVRFRTPGAQRRHTSPRWCEEPIVSPVPTTVADTLLAGAVRPVHLPDRPELLGDHLERGLEAALGIEQAWASGRVRPPLFAGELVQHALSCYELDPDAGDAIHTRLREQAAHDPIARAVARWIGTDRNRPHRSWRTKELTTLAHTAGEPPNLDEHAEIFSDGRRGCVPSLDLLIAAESGADACAPARELVAALAGRRGGSERTWERLATLTADAVRHHDHLFAVKAGLATALWNEFFLQDAAARASGLGDSPEGLETGILIDCVEACAHLPGHEVVGGDSVAVFDVADVRLRVQLRLQERDAQDYLNTTSRAGTRRPPAQVPAPDPGVRDEEGAPLPSRKRIFVSYVREDSSTVDRLVTELGEHGFDVWMDRTHLLAGQVWRSEIKKAIRAGDYFIGCFPPLMPAKMSRT
ncbi:toll/interleukin-1 receptor domain-containing protein [Amycolatopsis sp. WQ 127309]|uniref:toll/interleukin-1 receptor domain-containing protein n=1 Tax=Amycolatopsis sp. WQ 127309 TaxID=2932773 RepID=UPI001FF487D5|nr:TIR domain-containing protein [Amycolatopsis sp. WQ 127309]UOZ11346.1 TIR domain-containing protein [Amycolatopsis sp. WQ 127309]